MPKTTPKQPAAAPAMVPPAGFDVAELIRQSAQREAVDDANRELAEESGTDLVPVFSPQAMRVIRPASAALFNFDGDALRKWQLTALAQGGSVKDGRDMIDKPFRLRYWYVHEVEIEDTESGGTFTALRTVLFDSDCNAYGFVSDGVCKSLMGLIQIFGNRPLDPPIDMVVREISTKKGRRYYVLEPAGVK